MISPGLSLASTDNPFSMKIEPLPVETLFKNASREFLIAMAAGVEMETKTEQTPDGRHVFTMTTVPLVGIADMGDGRVIVCIREQSHGQDRKG